MNDAGQVVSWDSVAFDCCPFHAFLWTPGAGMVDLTQPGVYGVAVAVNDSGLVVAGSLDRGESDYTYFVWTPADGRVDLGTLAGGRWSVAYGECVRTHRRLENAAGGASRAVVWQVGSAAPGSANQAVTGGEVVNTDPGGAGATPAVPVQTKIEVPNGVSDRSPSRRSRPVRRPRGSCCLVSRSRSLRRRHRDPPRRMSRRSQSMRARSAASRRPTCRCSETVCRSPIARVRPRRS